MSSVLLNPARLSVAAVGPVKTWGSSSGSVAPGVDTVNASSFTTGAVNASTDETIFLALCFDNTNNSVSLPTITSISVPSGETATWTKLAFGDGLTASSGTSIREEVWALRTTQTWAAFQPVVNFSQATAAKVSMGAVKSGGSLLGRDALPYGAARTSFGSGSVTVANGRSGDLLLAFGASEAGIVPPADTDTVNGVWVSEGSSSTNPASTGGGNVCGQLQSKILTADGSQTYNFSATNADCAAIAILLRPAPTNYASAVFADGPLVFLNLDEATGTTAVDLSGGNHHGTITNSPTLNVPSAISGETAITFNGTTQGVDVPWFSSIQPASGYRATLECWIKTTVGGHALSRSGDADAPMSLNVNSATGKLNGITKSPSQNILVGATTVNDGSWHHIAFTVEPKPLSANIIPKLYVDGVLDATDAVGWSAPQTFSSGLSVASRGTSAWFTGSVAMAAYYVNSLSPTRIAAHYAAR